VSYSSLTDFANLGGNAAALQSVPTPTQQACLDAAKDVIDSFLRAQFTLPLVGTVGNDVKSAECRIAFYDVMVNRGYDPTKGSDINIRQRYEDSMAWLQLIADGKAIPNVTDSTPGATAGSTAGVARVISSSQRGFSNRGTTNTGGGFQGD
jgi:phage gp36-like protein